MSAPDVDAVVIGSGPNGLVAANQLADRGWKVLVLEAGPNLGGAVRSGEVTAEGFTSDLYSAFYPFAVASPTIAALHLERWGLRWLRSPLSLAHPTPDGGLAAIASTPTATAALLDELHSGDGAGWLELVDRWDHLGPGLVRALLAPFPPVRAAASLARGARFDDLAWLARLALQPVRRLGDETFGSDGAKALLAGAALHTDLTPDSAGSALFGWLLGGLAQQRGFPVPQGGAGRLTGAMADRLRSVGGEIRCGVPVVGIDVDDGRACGVITPDGPIAVRRAVLAGVTARSLYQQLLPAEAVPQRTLEAMQRWEPGAATVKVDWAVGTRIPWLDPRLHGAGTVHLADGLDALSRHACDLVTRVIPEEPFVILGQMTAVDPSRSPAGTESAWAYAHVPQAPHEGGWERDRVDRVVAGIERTVERYAPGFTSRIVARHVQGPVEMEAANANLIGGDLNAGTAQLHQQLVFRPVPGWARAETGVRGLYLASASAHPGGGVHGAPGANAARAATRHDAIRTARGAVRDALMHHRT